MKKNSIKKLAVVFFAAAALFSNISCGNITNNSESGTVTKNDNVTQKGTKVLIKPNISNISTARSIFPEITTEKLTNISIGLVKGKLNVECLRVYDDYAAFKDAELALEPGEYTFSLTAKCGGVILSAELPKTEYKASDEVIPLNFELTYVLEDAISEGEGNASFHFEYSKVKKMTEASVKFFKYDTNGELPKYAYNEQSWTEDKSKEDGTHFIDYVLENVPAGNYEIQFEVKSEDIDDDGIKTYSNAYYTNSVYIANDCTTVLSYVFENNYWINKYSVGSVIYTNESEHMKAVAKDDGIHITVRLTENDYEYSNMDIVEENSQIGINLGRWYYNDSQENLNANCTPTKNYKKADGTVISVPETTIIYPLVKKGQKYIFNLSRYAAPEDNDGKEYWNDSEKIIIEASEDGVNIFDDDYENKMRRMAVSVSSEKFAATLKYDIRKLFETIDSSIFSSFDVTGTVYAGDKSWGGNTLNYTVENGERVYHSWIADMNLLTKEGVENYLQFRKGIDYKDVAAISNCMELGNYWIETHCDFKLQNYENLFHTVSVESDVVEAPVVKFVTINLVKHEDEIKSTDYVEGDLITLPDYSSENWEDRVFVGWYTDPNFKQKVDITTIDCYEDKTFYAKWDLLITNRLPDGPDNYYGNTRFTSFKIENPDFEFGKNPIKVTVKGNAASDFEGGIWSHLVDYTYIEGSEFKNGYDSLSYSGVRNERKESYKTGDDIELVFIFDPCEYNIDVDLSKIEEKGICLFAHSSFQITNMSILVENSGTTITNEDGSITTTIIETLENGSTTESKITRAVVDSEYKKISEEIVVTDFDGNKYVTNTNSAGKTDRIYTYANGEIIETLVDEVGNVTGELKDKNGQNIELKEYVLNYNQYGPNYQLEIPLTDFLPESDFIKGDVVTISLKGFTKDSTHKYSYCIVSRASVDGDWKHLGPIDDNGDGYIREALNGIGDIFTSTSSIEIKKTAKTRDMQFIKVVIFEDLSETESKTSHRDSVSLMLNLEATIDKTNRVAPVTVSFESDVGTCPEPVKLYPGQAITEGIKGCFLLNWVDSNGNIVEIVPENDITLYAKCEELHDFMGDINTDKKDSLIISYDYLQNKCPDDAVLNVKLSHSKSSGDWICMVDSWWRERYLFADYAWNNYEKELHISVKDILKALTPTKHDLVFYGFNTGSNWKIQECNIARNTEDINYSLTKLIFDFDGGTMSDNPEDNRVWYQAGLPVYSIDTVKKEGYKFVGWYDDFGNEITVVPEETCTFHAKWEKEEPVSASITIEKSKDISVTTEESDTQVIFKASSGFVSYEWKMGNKVICTDSEFVFDKSKYPSESYMITLYAKKNDMTYSCNVYVEVE